MSRLQVAVFFVIGLQMSAGVLAAVEAEACWQPGTVRAEAEGVSVCVAGEGWRRAEAVAEAVGRAGAVAPICSTSDAGKLTCDTTCTTLGVCLSNGKWTEMETCPVGSLCVNGACKEGEKTCPTSDSFQCLHKGLYPNMKNCSTYFTCDDKLQLKTADCNSGFFFDACTGECDVESPDPCPWLLNNPCNEEGKTDVAPNNDRLHYLCARSSSGGMIQMWSKCTTGHFNKERNACERIAEPGCGPETATSTPPSTTTT